MSIHNHVAAAVVVVVSTLFLGSASAVSLHRKLSQPDDLISKLCKTTSYVDLCIESVKENIKGDPTGISVLNAEIDAFANATNQARARVKKLTQSASKEERGVLVTCDENFELAIYSVYYAKTAIASHDAAALNAQLSAMVTCVSTCEDSYAEFSIPSRLKAVDEVLEHLGINSLEISKAFVL